MTQEHDYAQYRLALFRGEQNLTDLVYTSSSDYDAGDTLPNFLMDVASKLLVLPREEREGFPMSLEIVPTWFIRGDEAIKHMDEALRQLDPSWWDHGEILELVRAIHNDPRPEMEPLKELIKHDLSMPYEDHLAAIEHLPVWSMTQGADTFLLDIVAARAKIGPYTTDAEIQRKTRLSLNQELSTLAAVIDEHGTIPDLYNVAPQHWLNLGEEGVAEHLAQASRFFGLPPFVKVDAEVTVPDGHIGYYMTPSLSRPDPVTPPLKGPRTYGDIEPDLIIDVDERHFQGRGDGFIDLLEFELDSYRGDKIKTGVIQLRHARAISFRNLEDAVYYVAKQLTLPVNQQLYQSEERAQHHPNKGELIFVAVAEDNDWKRGSRRGFAAREHKHGFRRGEIPLIATQKPLEVITCRDAKVPGLTPMLNDKILRKLEDNPYVVIKVIFAQGVKVDRIIEQLERYMRNNEFNRTPARYVDLGDLEHVRDPRGVVFALTKEG